MQVRNEVPVQKNERLLSAVPVHTFDDLGKDQDYIWYLIHGKMIDYVVDEKTGRMIRGSRKNEAFYEYWKFIHLNGHWFWMKSGRRMKWISMSLQIHKKDICKIREKRLQ